MFCAQAAGHGRMPASFAQTVDATAASQLVDPHAATIVATMPPRFPAIVTPVAERDPAR